MDTTFNVQIRRIWEIADYASRYYYFPIKAEVSRDQLRKQIALLNKASLPTEPESLSQHVSRVESKTIEVIEQAASYTSKKLTGLGLNLDEYELICKLLPLLETSEMAEEQRSQLLELANKSEEAIASRALPIVELDQSQVEAEVDRAIQQADQSMLDRKQPQLIVLVGPPGAGKTSTVNHLKLGVANVDTDEVRVRLMRANVEEDNYAQVLATHQAAADVVKQLVPKLISQRKSLLVQGTFTNLSKYQDWTATALERGYKVTVFFIHSTPAESWRRCISQRPRGVSLQYLCESYGQYAQFRDYLLWLQRRFIDADISTKSTVDVMIQDNSQVLLQSEGISIKKLATLTIGSPGQQPADLDKAVNLLTDLDHKYRPLIEIADVTK